MRRLAACCLLFSVFGGFLIPQGTEAATVSEVLAQARQAQSRVRELRSGGWSRSEQEQAIQILGPAVLNFVGASDLAQAAGSQAQRAVVREAYEALNGPLESIYDDAFAHINSMSKAVMDRDGDLEALYETREWKDAQLIASQSLYLLNWLRYIGSFVVEADRRKKILQQAADGFSEFAVGEQASQLKRESLFGRALCEKELRQYDWAVRDFELLLQDTGLPTDMERKVRASLAEVRARRSGKGAAPEPEDEQVAKTPSPDDMARAMLQRAQSLFERSKKESGETREKTRWEAIAHLEELRKKGGTWKEQADALAQAEMTQQETLALEEEKNPFPQWKEALDRLRKNEYMQAVPFLREVIASDDPRAARHHRDAQYFLAVGLFQQREYSDAASQLDAFLNADGVPARYGPEAAYLRFKATETLYARTKNPSEADSKLYLDAIKDLIRRYPGHKSIFEAYFRLGEYEHSHNNYLAAVEAYQKVTGDPAFRVRADYGILQCYFTVFEAFQEKKATVGLSEKDLDQRIASALQAFWKNSAALEQNPALVREVPLREYRGKATFMNAVLLSKNIDANATTIATLLQDFEQKYPEQKEAFDTVARTRLVALEKSGHFVDLEKDVDRIFANYNPDQQKELLKSLPEVLARDVKKLEKQNDKDHLLAAKRTLARLYADRLQRGEPFASDESPDKFKYDLAQLYLDVKDYDKAVALYQQLQQGAYSLAAQAGLAQIAAVRGDHRQAISHWEQMLKETQVGDPLWFRGTFEVAQLNATLGNTELACKTVSGTKPMLGRLGDQNLKKKIQELTTQSCRK